MKFTLYIVVMFFLCHFIGDYFFQSDWMALNKNKKTWNCLVHVFIYTACFLLLTLSWKALMFIGVTHFIFDRNPVIIKRLIWLKNHFPTGDYPPYEWCDSTSYFDDSPYNTYKLNENREAWIRGNCLNKHYGNPRPFFITIWLRIVCDNTLHLLCNLIALMLLA